MRTSLSELKDWIERVEHALSDFADGDEVLVDSGVHRIFVKYENEEFYLDVKDDEV